MSKSIIEHFRAWADEHNEQVEYASAYGEPGYACEKGVVLANWNNVPGGLANALEREGYECEWYDEWVIDYSYDKAWRTSPDSYSWTCAVQYDDDGELMTPDDDVSRWIEWAQCECPDETPRALPAFIARGDIEAAGWKLYRDDYESGFHPGQTDNPKEITKELMQFHDKVLFQHTENSQFYSKFAVYVPDERTAFDDFLAGYEECAAWLAYREDGTGNLEDVDAREYAFTDDTKAAIRSVCVDFWSTNRELMHDLNASQCGHDFFLTRNRHGTGFWDRGLGDLGTKLSEAAYTYGEQNVYLYSDGFLHVD